MKRVYCLYRVSSKKQVDKNENNECDIPMQRIACREFAKNMPGWVIVDEFCELGVSGSKVSAAKRDAIQILRDKAMKGEFDILLVFMFDRLGRIDDETPHVVEWFVSQGIELWSAKEGQQKFESHVDKLTNYIRFWQAAGESQKLSIRIKSKLNQMTADGLYTGGPIKFGYRLVDSGLVNRKNLPIRKYEIDPDESAIVAMMDEMTLSRGYGSHRLAAYLNEHGYTSHNGGKFTSVKVLRILRDPFYCGKDKEGNVIPALSELRIRSDETFGKLQAILEQRSCVHEERRTVARTTKGCTMLSGNVFCAHCGGRLTAMRYKDSYVRADGSVYSVDIPKYCCYHKARKLTDCDGQTTYRADWIDEAVTKIILEIFQCIEGAPAEDVLREALKKKMAGTRLKQKSVAEDLEKHRNQLKKLQCEIGKALTGESEFDTFDLTQALEVTRCKIEELEHELDELQDYEAEKKKGMEILTPAYNQFKTWSEEFGKASLEQKKMIACGLFRRIEIGRGYKISIEMNMSYKQFCSEWDTKGLFQNDFIS